MFALQDCQVSDKDNLLPPVPCHSYILISNVLLLKYTTMDNYKSLDKYQKLELMQDVNYCRIERHETAKYLKALWKNDTATIDYYESFGDFPRQIIMNKRDYDRHLLFGFTKKEFNQYGWLEKSDFLEKEHFEFPHRDGWAVSNHITIGRGINGKWSYGMSYSYSTGGSGYGLNAWGKIFDSRKECIITALEEMIKGLKRDSSTSDKYATKVLKQAKDLFDELTGRKAIQLSLF